jgi:hypothetical protein
MFFHEDPTSLRMVAQLDLPSDDLHPDQRAALAPILPPDGVHASLHFQEMEGGGWHIWRESRPDVVLRLGGAEGWAAFCGPLADPVDEW